MLIVIIVHDALVICMSRVVHIAFASPQFPWVIFFFQYAANSGKNNIFITRAYETW